MKRLVWLPVLLMLLAGCADGAGAASASESAGAGLALPRADPPYSMVLPGSDRLFEIEKTAAGGCWEAADGSCYLVTSVLETDPDTALTGLTGFSRERLHPVLDRCCGMERSRFSWTTCNEEGTFLCQGQILTDGERCYCMAACCREDADGVSRALCSEAFAGFGLYTDEGA